MQDRTRNLGDLWSGLALAALGTYIIVEALQWDYVTPEGPGPGFFPLWYGIAMLALSGVLVVSELARRSAGAKPINWNPLGRALSTWLALAASVALLKPLGFLVSFALLTYFIVAVMYRRPLKVAALVAAASAAGFFLVFRVALDVSLPVGVLGF
jgi:putative tricarboxylic transport membrane protein